MMRRTGWMAAAGLLIGVVTAVTPAAAVPIASGQTNVTVTAPLEALGLGAGLFGDASLVSATPLTVGFPVTGGSLNPDISDAVIEHDNSGVSLFALADPAIEATVGNFVIRTASGSVTGDIISVNGAPVGASGVPFFTFGPGTELPGVELLITSELSGALTEVFGAGDTTNATFGYAVPQVAPVPLPAGLVLMLAGVGALGIAGLRKGLRAA